MSIFLILKIFEAYMDIRALSYVRSPHNMAYMNDLLRACMWGKRGPTGSSLEKLQTVRESLDCLRADEVS